MITSTEFSRLLLCSFEKKYFSLPPIFLLTYGQILKFNSSVPQGLSGADDLPWDYLQGNDIWVPYPHFFVELQNPGHQVWLSVTKLRSVQGTPCLEVISSDSPDFCMRMGVLGTDDARVANGVGYELYDGKTLREGIVKDNGSVQGWVTSIACTVSILLEILFQGSCHKVLREPQKPGKSVHWIKSRSRIVLIDNRELIDLQNAANVKRSDEEHEAQNRAAHARRGFVRTLRAPRYLEGGQEFRRVPVRACWVGPKEWEDKSAQVIYKLVE